MGQLSLDLFAQERRDPVEEFTEWFCRVNRVEGGAVGLVRSHAAQLLERFGSSGMWDRGKALAGFYGAHRCIGSLTPHDFGVDDPSIGYHVVWDRVWAVRNGVPPEEARFLKCWDYGRKCPDDEEGGTS